MTSYAAHKAACAALSRCIRRGCYRSHEDGSLYCIAHQANQQRRQREAMRRLRMRGGRRQMLLFTSAKL